MTEKKPLKRHKSLQPLSRDHHHGLLLSWKIRTGFKKNVEANRIKTYTDWFYTAHLIPHFEMEEAHIFSLLAEDNLLRIQAIDEHKQIKDLIENTDNLDENLNQIADVLEKHIRFEERVLFPEIQNIATPEEMAHIETIHYEPNIPDKIDDEFWK
ncbi:hemerythrin domain-containing protein [Formosa sp. PL04]|uniref:hemerythrin domain-containing protein n=1 Tax=Formosa sp. PL04 TaxID=3081755 RepID=UPI002982A744|nr:hemerythrin domain-containing protein [Formosa sp. PL04]MDW5290671.1 hemerythrin domain-containing protein [Formosa sp. PL04]